MTSAGAAAHGLPITTTFELPGRRVLESRGAWVATDEVFRDPVSGRVMRVWVDPTDGARHYAPSEP